MMDTELLESFRTCTLAGEAWTHEAHLRIAWMHLRESAGGVDAAHILMRVGIVRLNAAHGLVETVTRGYHETLTRVWLMLVKEEMERGEMHTDSLAFLSACQERLRKDAPLRLYSRERMMSMEARARFVEP